MHVLWDATVTMLGLLWLFLHQLEDRHNLIVNFKSVKNIVFRTQECLDETKTIYFKILQVALCNILFFID